MSNAKRGPFINTQHVTKNPEVTKSGEIPKDPEISKWGRISMFAAQRQTAFLCEKRAEVRQNIGSLCRILQVQSDQETFSLLRTAVGSSMLPSVTLPGLLASIVFGDARTAAITGL
jgi:hypothetical protein